MQKNRAFWYGENFFFSCRTYCGKVIFLEDHLALFISNIREFYAENVNWGQILSFENNIKMLLADCQKITQEAFNKEQQEFYVRVTLIPTSDKFQLDSSLNLNAQIYFSNLEIKKNSCLIKFLKREQLAMPYGKVGMYLDQIKMLNDVKKEGYDEIIYFDDNDELLEATTSNICFVDQNKKTYFIHENHRLIYHGLIIRKLKIVLESLGYKFLENHFDKKIINPNLNIILTNSVSLIRAAKLSNDSPVDGVFIEKLNSELIKLLKKE